VAGASAQAKARRLGIAEERKDDGEIRGEPRTQAPQQRTVRLLGRDIAVAEDGAALDKGKPASAAGVRTYPACAGLSPASQCQPSAAPKAAANCIATKAGTSPGAIPANVAVMARARVTAGLAKLVEAVNQ
jgi:hypothetical protein